MLDEAAGLRKKEEEVAPQALQQGTAEVASWNKKKVWQWVELAGMSCVHI